MVDNTLPQVETIVRRALSEDIGDGKVPPPPSCIRVRRPPAYVPSTSGRCDWGGGQNHRLGLYDMVLIKDNHIAAVGSISEAVARVRAEDKLKRPIEVEVKTLAEFKEALVLDVDRIMLDSMSLAKMREAVRVTGGCVPLEASGNVSLENVGAIAATGVDYISVGLLTHSVQALDISLELEAQI